MATMCLPHVSKNAYSFPGFVPLTLGTFFPPSDLDRNKEGNSSKFSGSCMKGGKGQNCEFFFFNGLVSGADHSKLSLNMAKL